MAYAKQPQDVEAVLRTLESHPNVKTVDSFLVARDLKKVKIILTLKTEE